MCVFGGGGLLSAGGAPSSGNSKDRDVWSSQFTKNHIQDIIEGRRVLNVTFHVCCLANQSSVSAV